MAPFNKSSGCVFFKDVEYVRGSTSLRLILLYNTSILQAPPLSVAKFDANHNVANVAIPQKATGGKFLKRAIFI